MKDKIARYGFIALVVFVIWAGGVLTEIAFFIVLFVLIFFTFLTVFGVVSIVMNKLMKR